MSKDERIEANVAELKRAANNHRKQAHELATAAGAARPCRSAVMLRFYGVESGMKAQYLMDRRLRTTREIEDAFGKGGHDLCRGLRALRVPAVVGKAPVLHRKSKTAETVQIKRSHEALRYGIELERSDFDALDAWLCRILDWLTKEGVS
jgi:hypothetical protein